MPRTLIGHVLPVLAMYFTAMDLITFVIFWWDKRCAKKGSRRVRESTLLWLCALGGGLGGLLSMHLFRHKTLKRRFAVGVPLMLAAQACLLVFLGWRCLS